MISALLYKRQGAQRNKGQAPCDFFFESIIFLLSDNACAWLRGEKRGRGGVEGGMMSKVEENG